MAKAPPNVPTAVGDRVKMRGKGGDGIVLQITPKDWVEIEWQPNIASGRWTVQPRICHLFELEKISAN